MCTLMIMYKAKKNYPIIVAANRDEYYNRDSKLPGILYLGTHSKIRVLAGQDVRAGGTWLGVNQWGVVAGITNRSTGRPRDDSKKSRGSLVLSCLEKRSAAEIVAMIKQEDAEQYNPFNLWFADMSEAYLFTNHEKKRIFPLLEKICILTNVDLENRDPAKQNRARGLLGILAQKESIRLEDLQEICASHEGRENPLEPFCVHTESYGTVSSTVMFISEKPFRSKYYHCEGAPCSYSYQDYSTYLHSLFNP